MGKSICTVAGALFFRQKKTSILKVQNCFRGKIAPIIEKHSFLASVGFCNRDLRTQQAVEHGRGNGHIIGKEMMRADLEREAKYESEQK